MTEEQEKLEAEVAKLADASGLSNEQIAEVLEVMLETYAHLAADDAA